MVEGYDYNPHWDTTDVVCSESDDNLLILLLLRRHRNPLALEVAGNQDEHLLRTAKLGLDAEHSRIDLPVAVVEVDEGGSSVQMDTRTYFQLADRNPQRCLCFHSDRNGSAPRQQQLTRSIHQKIVRQALQGDRVRSSEEAPQMMGHSWAGEETVAEVGGSSRLRAAVTLIHNPCRDWECDSWGSYSDLVQSNHNPGDSGGLSRDCVHWSRDPFRREALRSIHNFPGHVPSGPIGN